jgi:adenosine deaminase CECR1
LYNTNIWLTFKLLLHNILQTYELDGSTTDMMGVVSMYQKEVADFLSAQQPGDWLGARFIYAPIRAVDNASVTEYVTTVVTLVRDFPEFIAGFDLVGQEDKGRPYSDFVNQLLWLRDQVPDIKYFFHAGETSKYCFFFLSLKIS